MGVDSPGCDLVGGVGVLLVVQLGKLDLIKDLAVHRDFEPVSQKSSPKRLEGYSPVRKPA